MNFRTLVALGNQPCFECGRSTVLGSEQLESREYLRVIDALVARGAECVIEGCTEIVMLVEQRHTQVPLFDTTAIHALAAAERALGATSA